MPVSEEQRHRQKIQLAHIAAVTQGNLQIVRPKPEREVRRE
jgi:hypothetical protein